MQNTVKISDDTYKKLKEIKNATERPFVWILKRAVENYYKITLGNRIKNKE